MTAFISCNLTTLSEGDWISWQNKYHKAYKTTARMREESWEAMARCREAESAPPDERRRLWSEMFLAKAAEQDALCIQSRMLAQYHRMVAEGQPSETAWRIREAERESSVAQFHADRRDEDLSNARNTPDTTPTPIEPEP